MTTGKPVTIAVTGTHSTGKSTFLAHLVDDLCNQGLAVATVADLGEQAQRLGLPILCHHTWHSTMWIICRGISLELQAWVHADVLLVDRPAPDALGYYRAALHYRGERTENAHTATLETLVRHHSQHYDLIFRTILDPDMSIGDNKPRDTDQRFRALADQHINGVLHDLRLPHRLLPSTGQDAALARARSFITDALVARAHERRGRSGQVASTARTHGGRPDDDHSVA